MIRSIQQVPVIAALAAAISIATVYVILGGNIGSSRKSRKGPRGLTNYGRACYMNAVLQLLASSSVIERWLVSSQPSFVKRNLLKW